MKLNEKILFLVLLFCIFIRFISGFPIDNSQLPGGTDTCWHLHRVWYVTNKGMPKWDYYIYGGQQFLRYYSPFAYLITGMLGRVFGLLFSYKLVNNIILALSILVFFYFLKEFNLSTEKIIIALIFFTFIPIYSYYLFDGRFPSIFSIPLCLMYWIYLKKTIDKRKLEYLLMSGLFLALSILTNYLTAILIFSITFVWTLLYKTKVRVLYYFISIMFVGLILSSWWVFPFILETCGTSTAGYESIIKTPSITNFQKEITIIFGLNIFQFEFGLELTILLITLISFSCLLSLFTLKNKISRDFFILILLFVLFLLIFRYRRSFIFLPIPLSIVIAHGITKLKKNLKVIFSIVFFIIILIGFFSIKPLIYEFPQYPSVPKDGRVIFLPLHEAFFEEKGENKFKCSVLISPIHGNENILGWSVSPKTIGKTFTFTLLSIKKIKYNALLENPLDTTSDEYYSLLKDGWVNYVVVNKNRQDLLNYFENSDKFQFKNEDDKFIVFEMVPKSTYVEINGKMKSANFTKNNDKILIDMNCEPGNVTIKERYDMNWKALIDNETVNVEETDYGFMQIKTMRKDRCRIELRYETEKYYEIFNLISITGWFFVITYLFIVCYMRRQSKRGI